MTSLWFLFKFKGLESEVKRLSERARRKKRKKGAAVVRPYKARQEKAAAGLPQSKKSRLEAGVTKARRSSTFDYTQGKAAPLQSTAGAKTTIRRSIDTHLPPR